MSNAPNGWQAPRTNWATTDPITTTDLNRIEGNANATETGARTLDQALANPANVGTLRQILSWFAGRIRAITGATNWWDAPATTLATAHTHHGRADNPHAVTVAQIGAETPAGAQARVDTHANLTTAHSATAVATADRIVIRDANGRAQVAAPAVAADIARLDTVTTHAALTAAGTHGSAVAATANTLIHRDANGRAQVAAPAVAADIATREYVDSVATHPRQLYTGDETEVSVTSTTNVTRKSARITRSTGHGLNVTRIGVVAELRATAGTATLDIFVNNTFLFALTTTSTSYVLVQNTAAVTLADNSINLIEMRLRNSTTGTTFNRVFEVYV